MTGSIEERAREICRKLDDIPDPPCAYDDPDCANCNDAYMQHIATFARTIAAVELERINVDLFSESYVPCNHCGEAAHATEMLRARAAELRKGDA